MIVDLSQRLIEKLNKSDSKAFQKIYTCYYGTLCVFANRYVRNSEEAEDIVQDSFISLWDQRMNIKNMNHLKSFLYQTTKNTCLNAIKHRNVKEKYVEQTRPQSDDRFFEEQIIRSEVIRIIRYTVKRLPRKRQEIIFMSMQGMKNPEIARALDISVNTVKLQKKLAYEYLRSRLKNISFLFLL